MDNLQRSELDSFNRVDDFIIKHEDILNPIPEFAPEKDKFMAALQSVKDAGIAQTHHGIDHSMSHVFLSNEEGLVSIEHHRSGKYHFTISSATRIEVGFATTIKRGTNNHFTVKLKKA